MWKAAIPAAILLTIVLAIEWPHAHGQSVPKPHVRAVNAKPAPPCAKKLLTDWVRNNRIDRKYRRECYEAALAMMPEDGYGLDVRSAVEAQLQASG